jgi:hypothetical protein
MTWWKGATAASTGTRLQVATTVNQGFVNDDRMSRGEVDEVFIVRRQSKVNASYTATTNIGGQLDDATRNSLDKV